jgi:outer membrane protein TolC
VKKRVIACIALLFIFPSHSFSSQETVVVDPETLYSYLLANNLSIKEAALNVRVAKDKVTHARRQLLPGIGAGLTLLSAGEAGLTFSAIDVVLPFLLPWKWFNVRKSKKELMAQKVSFHLVKMNEYASALSIYATLQEALITEELLKQDYESWAEIEELIHQAHSAGWASIDDVNQARGRAALAKTRVFEIHSFVSEQLGYLKEMLALPMNTEIELVDYTIPASEMEWMTMDEALEVVRKSAPEYLQTNYLLAAARDGKLSSRFAFITGVSVGSRNFMGGGVDTSFDSMIGSAQFSFGADYFSQVKLSSRNVETIELHLERLDLSFQRAVDVIRKQIQSSLEIHRLANEAETHLQSVYKNSLKKLVIGETSLTAVIELRLSITEATLRRASAQKLLNLLRITLHRMVGSGDFNRVEGCKYIDFTKKGWWKEAKKYAKPLDGSGC